MVSKPTTIVSNGNYNPALEVLKKLLREAVNLDAAGGFIRTGRLSSLCGLSRLFRKTRMLMGDEITGRARVEIGKELTTKEKDDSLFDLDVIHEAFEWFLLEKAEYWLEKVSKHPVVDEIGVKASWENPRIRAGAQAVDENVNTLAVLSKMFKAVVKESAVPAWIPPTMPWDKVEKKFKTEVPVIAKNVRDKLNVPRDRIRVPDKGVYVWAGVEHDQ